MTGRDCAACPAPATCQEFGRCTEDNRPGTAPGAWHCEAYGPEGVKFGALCFVSGDGERACGDQDECGRVMAAERRRVFRRISERAASGDPTMAYLEGEFTSPEQLLGGGQEPGQ